MHDNLLIISFVCIQHSVKHRTLFLKDFDFECSGKPLHSICSPTNMQLYNCSFTNDQFYNSNPTNMQLYNWSSAEYNSKTTALIILSSTINFSTIGILHACITRFHKSYLLVSSLQYNCLAWYISLAYISLTKPVLLKHRSTNCTVKLSS